MKEIENKLIAGGEALKLRPAAVAVIFAALTLLKLLCGADSISRKNPNRGEHSGLCRGAWAEPDLGRRR